MFSNGIGFMSRAIERNAFFISAEVGGFKLFFCSFFIFYSSFGVYERAPRDNC